MIAFRLVWILQLMAFAFAHFMCELAQITCDADLGTEACFAHFGNSFVTSKEATVFQVTSRLKCSALCLLKKNCICLLFLNGKNCILVFTSTLVDEASGLLTVAGPAISFGKDTYSTSQYSPNAIYASSNAVDQDFWGTYYFSMKTLKSWWLVDLGENYIISEMRINFLPRDTTHDIRIKFGHTLKTDGDLSSYDKVVDVPRIHPRNDNWFFVRPSTKEQYRYVSLQILGTQTDHLVLYSVEVYTNP